MHLQAEAPSVAIIAAELALLIVLHDNEGLENGHGHCLLDYRAVISAKAGRTWAADCRFTVSLASLPSIN